jgi:hypothetical protein
VIVIAVVSCHPSEPMTARPVTGVRDPQHVGDRATRLEPDGSRIPRSDATQSDRPSSIDPCPLNAPG